MRGIRIAAVLLVALSGVGAGAQSSVPILSGGVGFLSSTTSGSTFLQPVIAPVLVAPIGKRWLVESRADLRGFVHPTNGTGPYEAEFFPTLEYAQVDFIATSWLTITAGRFLTPFDIYNERLTPIWIHNFQDAPFIVPIGTEAGYSDGAMVRGALLSRDNFQLTYTAYFSALSTANKLESQRSAGGRASIFLPQARLETGASYGRMLQNQRMNFAGVFLSWQPYSAPLDVKGEYAHSPRGQGYWIEAAYRLSQFHGPDSALGRLEPLARVQQFQRLQQGSGDSLPGTNAQRFDTGLNYFLPHEIRLNASFGRQFSRTGDRNVWDFGVTYRFLFPLFPGGSH